MKPYANLLGKIRRPYFWGDRIKKKYRRLFKKSARQINKKLTNESDILY